MNVRVHHLMSGRDTAAVAVGHGLCVSDAPSGSGFWWFGYGYFSQEPGCH